MTAIGYVTKQTDGRYKGTLRTVSIQAEIDIVPNQQKTSDSHPDSHGDFFVNADFMFSSLSLSNNFISKV